MYSARSVAVLAAFFLPTATSAENLATARLTLPIVIPAPSHLQTVSDPASGTPFTRVSKPGPLGAGVECGRDYCRHRYSSAQAWNADQSLLMLVNGCNGFCFLDGRSYAPLFRRSRAGECEWHPKIADQMICIADRSIAIWEPRTNLERIVFSPSDYRGLQFGPYKGNPSIDGRRIAVRATTATGVSVVFAYDLVERRKFPDIALDRLPGKTNSCTISPRGLHVMCFQNTTEGVDQAFVFSVDGVLSQSWLEHHRPGHGDLTIDADGSEVYVGISKSPPDQYQVIKRRLTDGAVTRLAAYGEAQHASLRAIQRPGWVFLTYAGDPQEIARRPRWAPFAREVIALRIDGSGEFRRIVQTHGAPQGYWSEAQASPSPDGSQVIWSSNWGERNGAISDYVARLTWPQEQATE